MKTDLTVTKISLPDSYFVKYEQQYEEAIVAMQQLVIIVQKPGNLSDPAVVERALDLVNRSVHYEAARRLRRKLPPEQHTGISPVCSWRP